MRQHENTKFGVLSSEFRVCGRGSFTAESRRSGEEMRSTRTMGRENSHPHPAKPTCARAFTYCESGGVLADRCFHTGHYGE
jgi:hypothetical protein